MQITTQVASGQKSAKRLLCQYGVEFICVFYHYDDQNSVKTQRNLSALLVPTREQVVELINPALQGLDNYFAIGDSSR